MIHVERVQDVYSSNTIPWWLVSAFKAGYINTVGFLMAGKFVSHVTGFGTLVGVAIGHEDYFFGIELLIIPLSFIFGGVLTSFILDRERSKGELPPYWLPQVLITLLLLIVIVVGEIYLGAEKIPFDQDNKYNAVELLMITLLCLVCGLKNSLVTWSTYGKIRVTHLTGLSTDIGLNFLRMLNPGMRGSRFQEDRSVNVLRIFTFLSFSCGAFLSALLFPRYNYHVLVIPVIISIGMSVFSIMRSRKLVLAEEVSQ